MQAEGLTYQQLGAALGVIVVSQVLPRDLYTPLAAQHVPQPIACHHHELILHYQSVLVDLRICTINRQKHVSQQHINNDKLAKKRCNAFKNHQSITTSMRAAV